MTEQTLIEGLKQFIRAYEEELSEDPYGRSLIEAAIAALSPVLPEEVTKWRKMLTEIGGYENELQAVNAGAARKMIDLIERLALEKQYELNWREQLQQRIKELEGEDGPGYWMSLVDAAREQRDKAKDQITKYENALDQLASNTIERKPNQSTTEALQEQARIALTRIRGMK